MASRVFSPGELESLDSYMMKYCKYGIVELSDAPVMRALPAHLRATRTSTLKGTFDGVYVSASTS